MARQPSDRSSGVDREADDATGRTARTDEFWDDLDITPIEVALPGGVGYTLRAYRMSSGVTPSDISERVAEVEMPTYSSPLDEEEISDADLYPDDSDTADEDGDLETDGDDAGKADEGEADEGEADEADEEVPLFLSHAGHLLLFKSAESLVTFVQSGAENDMRQLDAWERLASGIRPEYVTALPEDQYELDLVVSNLRGGPEVWDPELLVQCGQLARDLGHALTIEAVVTALAPGSPLDDLDEALRGVAAGGVGTFFARRRARKVGKETASLAWRTVIGKISAVVDWRD